MYTYIRIYVYTYVHIHTHRPFPSVPLVFCARVTKLAGFAFSPSNKPGPAAGGSGLASATVMIEVTSATVMIEVKGICSQCGSPVLSNQERGKDPKGLYVHVACLNAAQL